MNKTFKEEFFSVFRRTLPFFIEIYRILIETKIYKFSEKMNVPKLLCKKESEPIEFSTVCIFQSSKMNI